MQKVRNACYFIRHCNWLQMTKYLEEKDGQNIILSELKNNVLLNYAKKLYIPVSRYRRQWLRN